jgi:hypothetical protein
MIPDNYEEKLKRIEALLSNGFLELYTEGLATPEKHSLIFIGEVPDKLLEERGAQLKERKGFREWVLITDMSGGSEWLDEMEGVLGLNVIEVDDLKKAELALRQLVRPQQKKVAGM